MRSGISGNQGCARQARRGRVARERKQSDMSEISKALSGPMRGYRIAVEVFLAHLDTFENEGWKLTTIDLSPVEKEPYLNGWLQHGRVRIGIDYDPRESDLRAWVWETPWWYPDWLAWARFERIVGRPIKVWWER